MTEEKDNFTYIVPEHSMRNARFFNHPYSQSSPQFESNLQNDLTQLTPLSHVARIKGQPPESPSTSLDTSEDCKLTDVIKLPENLENLPKADEFPTKRSRWNTNEEILALLLNFPKHEDWQSKDVVIRPESGSMLMYSRKKVRYRRDGYCWKKRKDGKTTREDHMKLKVQGVECIYGCYVHSAVLPTFHRRCYWLLQNPDIVLVHYLNVPYPDDSKLAALIPNIAFWTEKKEWTREELLLQLKPMYESLTFENGKENETEEAKLNRLNQISSFIESMVAQLLEKQRYVRAALANSLECGCGNRKCLGASRCTRPIRRISSARKQNKRSSALSTKIQDKRSYNMAQRNALKTPAMRKVMEMNNDQVSSPSGYYNSSATSMADPKSGVQPQVQQSNTQQLQQLLQNPVQPDVHQQITPHNMHPKLHQQIMQPANTEEMMTYGRSEVGAENYMSGMEFVNTENQNYPPNYTCPLSEPYVPNNDVENANIKQEVTMNESIPTLITYNTEENEFATTDKYQSDTTDISDSNSYSTIHLQHSPNNSYTSVDDTETYGNGDLFEDLMMNVNSTYNYENVDYNTNDHNLYELIIQLTQKEKKTTTGANSVVTCEKVQQYSIQNENCEGYSSTHENNLQPLSDNNGNFLNSYSRYSANVNAHQNATNGENSLTPDFVRIENNYMTSYPPDVDVNFMETSTEFSSAERSIPNPPMRDANQSDPPYTIIDLAPEWSYCEGGTKLLIIGPWYFQTEYAVLFDSYSVPATLIQAGVLKCYCPEHAVGLVSLQVVSAGSIISNTVVFEYKKRINIDENVCHDICNIKAEQYNQYTYENDTLLKFILIQRIESIQEDAYKHNCPPTIVNKYESLPAKTTM